MPPEDVTHRIYMEIYLTDIKMARNYKMMDDDIAEVERFRLAFENEEMEDYRRALVLSGKICEITKNTNQLPTTERRRPII
jgi:hypothetical protein